MSFWTDWPRGLKATNDRGRIINAAWMKKDIRGRRILNVTRRGKVLFFELSGQPKRLMAVHLRMSGRLEVVPASPQQVNKYRRPSILVKLLVGRWVHFWWRLSGGREMRLIDPRKFGRIWYGASDELQKDPYLGGLGIDAKGLTKNAFITAFRERRGMIKPLLLRQDVIAGIGNILADESLWHAGIHPKAGVPGLNDAALGRLHGGLEKTIRAVLASGGTSMRNFRHPDGKVGRYQERRVAYGSAGRPCPRCRMPFVRIVVAGRGTTFCSQCQKI